MDRMASGASHNRPLRPALRASEGSGARPSRASLANIVVDWSRIDDYTFVKLVGELFARLEFVDVDYQGDGPDGGIDLFATELLPFAVQGRVPFRWAVQYKFSVKGAAASVNDSEVSDVEGILRSDRYQVQEPRGYMLVTNRRIVQNVVERLRGIDRRSQFRTARIDGSGLESMLANHQEILERYMGDPTQGPLGLGRPTVIVAPSDGGSGHVPPTLLVELSGPTGKPTLPGKIRAVVDTGASISVIPLQAAQALNLQPVGHLRLSSVLGDIRFMPQFKVRIGIEQLGQSMVQTVAAQRDTAILGRDFLGGFGVFIRPDGGVNLYKPRPEIYLERGPALRRKKRRGIVRRGS